MRKKVTDPHARGRSSKQKGAKGERELAKTLNELLGINSIRGRQFCGAAGNPDVILKKEADGELVDIPGLHVECKRVEVFKLYPALEQSINDARTGEVPVVCHRKNNKPWVLVVELDRLKDLAAWVMSLEETNNVSGSDG